MTYASRSFVSLFALEADQDIRRTAIAAVRLGYAVIPVAPGGKVPLCTLNVREYREAGKDHDCGVYHAITDEKTADRVFTRLAKIARESGAPHNLGIVAGPSRIITVDADNAEPVAAFQRDWAAATGDSVALTPTVMTPGVEVGVNGTREWKHKDGGHWHFVLPDGVDLDYRQYGVLKAEGDYDIKWGWTQALVPPSVRPEGRYRATADLLEAPAWLIERIEGYLAMKAERRERLVSTIGNDSIAQWSVSTPWATLLSAHGWTDSGKADKCGCACWEKPGGGSTYKSATAHEAECDRYDLAEGHGPLHLWTTDPPEELARLDSPTITKLQFVAAMEHGGNVAEAIEALDLDKVDLYGWVADANDRQAPSEPVGADTPADTEPLSAASAVGDPQGTDQPTVGIEHETQPQGTPPVGDHPADSPKPTAQPTAFSQNLKKATDQIIAEYGIPDGSRADVYNEVQKITLRKAASAAYDRAIMSAHSDIDSWLPDAGFIDDFLNDAPDGASPSIMTRTDGKALFYRGRVNCIVGRRGAGKTWLAIVASIQVLQAGGRVLYIDMEDTRLEWKARFKAVGHLETIETAVREGRAMYRDPDGFPSDEVDRLVEYMGTFDLVIFDVLNRLTARMGGDTDVANPQVMWLYDNLFNPLSRLDTAVLLLDHPNKKGQRKDAEQDDKGPGGGAVKMNNANGHVVSLDIVVPFSKDRMGGESNLLTLKDRCGHYEEGTVAARMLGTTVLDADGVTMLEERMTLDIAMPTVEAEVDEDAAQEAACRARILELLTKHGPSSKRDLQRNMSKKQAEKFSWSFASLDLSEDIVLNQVTGLWELAPEKD